MQEGFEFPVHLGDSQATLSQSKTDDFLTFYKLDANCCWEKKNSLKYLESLLGKLSLSVG